MDKIRKAPRKQWSQHEHEILKRMWASSLPTKTLAEYFSCSVNGIVIKARKLGFGSRLSARINDWDRVKHLYL